MKSYKIILVISLSIFSFSCTLFDNSKEISVSFSSDRTVLLNQSASISRVAYDIKPFSDDTYFKTERKDANRGAIKKQYDPELFFLDLDYLLVYNKDKRGYSTEYLLGYLTQPSGGIIPRHVNLFYSKNLIRDFEISKSLWDGISMQFLPQAPSSSNDGHYVMSIIGIDLGASYSGVQIPGEIDQSLINVPNPSLHYFSLETLQPYMGTFLSYITIGNDIDAKGIQNPSGVSGTWETPGNTTNGNSTQLFFPGSSLNFSLYENPEIIFHWNMENLIEIYEGPTASLDDDIVTLNLSDPFPISLIIQEKTHDNGSIMGDSIPPDEVFFPAISGSNTYNTIQWINPEDNDFNKVVIVRKIGSAPASLNDGTIVYESHEPNFCDSTGSSGNHYYYRIYTVDHGENYSNGVVLDQVQY